MKKGRSFRRFAAGCALAAALLLGASSVQAPLSSEYESLGIERKTGVNIPSDGRRDLVGCIHVHTSLSHDSDGTKDELLTGAAEAGLDFVMTTEHANRGDEAVRAYEQSLRGEHGRGKQKRVLFLFLPGFEFGSILAIHPSGPIARKGKTPDQIIKEIREKNGLAVHGHVEKRRHLTADFDAIEIYNIHGHFLANRFRTILDLLTHAGISGLSLEPLAYLLEQNTETWDNALARGEKMPAIMASDMHIKPYYPWDYALFFQFARQHVRVKEKSVDALMDGLKRGHSHIGFDLFGDTSDFRYSISGKEKNAFMGDQIELDRPLVLRLQAPETRKRTRTRVIRNGALEWRAPHSSLELSIEKPGAYRAEIDILTGGEYRAWIVSNPIYVTSGAQKTESM